MEEVSFVSSERQKHSKKEIAFMKGRSRPVLT